jgi:hypothetical protein
MYFLDCGSFPSNHFSLDPSLLVGRCVPLYVIGSIRTRHTCLFCLWDISDDCISLVARRAVKVFFLVLHEQNERERDRGRKEDEGNPREM